MSPLDDAFLAECERHDQAATPGPWSQAPWHDRTILPKAWADDPEDVPPEDRGPFASIYAMRDTDAAFIAFARTAAPRLVAGYREVLAERDNQGRMLWAAQIQRNDERTRADAAEAALRDMTAECDEETLAALGNERTWRWQAEAALRDERALSANYEGALRLILDHEVAGHSADLAGEALTWRVQRGSEPT